MAVVGNGGERQGRVVVGPASSLAWRRHDRDQEGFTINIEFVLRFEVKVQDDG